MNLTATVLLPLAVICFVGGCRTAAVTRPPTAASPSVPEPGPRTPLASAPSSQPFTLSADALLPSPRLIVGRVVAVEPERGFVFVALAPDAPAAALEPDSVLLVRTVDLKETARVRVSPYLRSRTLGTRIVSGQASSGDEVVWQAP